MEPRENPFPGMDPYLEAKWPAVHARLIVYASNQLNPQLPDDLQTNIEETLAVCVDEDFSHSIRPDLHIVEEDSTRLQQQASAIALAEPMILRLPGRPERHLEIVDAAGRVVTVIEFLSPWNKTGRGRERYVRKQASYLDSDANLVEIDLVRRGEHVLAGDEVESPPAVRRDSIICIYRATEPDQMEIYRAPLRERLPNIPIPLRRGEKDVVLQLQPLIDECYRDGRYYRTNYQEDPQPALSPDDAQWLNALLRAQGFRS